MTVRLPAAERRKQLLEAALTVFASDGYHETTMESIAAEAGVTKPVLYQHFSSKRELFHELLKDVGQRMSVIVGDAAASTESPHKQVQFGFRAYFDFVDQNPEQFRLIFGDGVRADPEFAREVFEFERLMASFIAELITTAGLSDDERLVLAHGIVGLAEATGRHWTNSSRPGTSADLADQVAELAWSGLRGHPDT